MLGVLTKNRKQTKTSQTSHLNSVPPEWVEAPTEWYEVALVERGNGSGRLEIKVVRRAFDPDITFTEDDGIEQDTEYAAIFRKVKIDDDGELLYGMWTDPTTWARPFARRKANVD